MSFSLSLAGGKPATYDLAIIGGGPSGATAALYAARADLRTVVLDRLAAAGALASTSRIANYPGVPEVITGAELLDRIRRQAADFGAEFVQAQVVGASLTGDPKVLQTSVGPYQAHAVIIATGKMGRKQRVPGEEEFLGRGVSYCATCDGAFFRGREVAVVGHGEQAIEEALFLTQFAARVIVFAPGESLSAKEESQAVLLANPKVEVRYRRPLRAVLGDGLVTGIKVGGPSGEEVVPVAGVFIYLPGSSPILDFVSDDLKLTEQGCVEVGHDRSTSIPGVFAAGDVLCSFIQQAVVAAADGAIAAMAAEKYVRGRQRARSDWG